MNSERKLINLYGIIVTLFLQHLLIPQASAHEFAYAFSTRVIQTQDAGTGRAIGFYYGGFGLLAGIELKNYPEESTGSLNVKAMLKYFSMELGLSNISPSIKAEALLPLLRHSTFLANSHLSLGLGYEISVSDNDYSGAYLGINLLVFD
jgi:hypothetical protein